MHSAPIRIFWTEILVCHPALERIRSPSPGCHPPGSSPLILVSMVMSREAESPRGIGLDSSPWPCDIRHEDSAASCPGCHSLCRRLHQLCADLERQRSSEDMCSAQ